MSFLLAWMLIMQIVEGQVVRPFFTCWYPSYSTIGTNQYTRTIYFVFGYENGGQQAIIPYGAQNRLEPTALYQFLQVQDFYLSLRQFAFKVPLDASLIPPTWILDSNSVSPPTTLDGTSLCSNLFVMCANPLMDSHNDPGIFVDFCQSPLFCNPISVCDVNSNQCNASASRCGSLLCNETTLTCFTAAPTKTPTTAPTNPPTYGHTNWYANSRTDW